MTYLNSCSNLVIIGAAEIGMAIESTVCEWRYCRNGRVIDGTLTTTDLCGRREAVAFTYYRSYSRGQGHIDTE